VRSYKQQTNEDRPRQNNRRRDERVGWVCPAAKRLPNDQGGGGNHGPHRHIRPIRGNTAKKKGATQQILPRKMTPKTSRKKKTPCKHGNQRVLLHKDEGHKRKKKKVLNGERIGRKNNGRKITNHIPQRKERGFFGGERRRPGTESCKKRKPKGRPRYGECESDY